jgi:predicted RecB family nuclease
MSGEALGIVDGHVNYMCQQIQTLTGLYGTHEKSGGLATGVTSMKSLSPENRAAFDVGMSALLNSEVVIPCEESVLKGLDSGAQLQLVGASKVCAMKAAVKEEKILEEPLA